MATITTRQGDTWDILAKRQYGDESYMVVLINANLSHRKTVIFPAGIDLNAPDIAEEDLDYDDLPPWKREG
nr:MAG TPA: baseplate wedge protein [Caudoviricetes sp.]